MNKSNLPSTKIKLLDEKAEVPTRAHDTDTGYDLKFIGVDKIVGDVIFFKTGIAVAPPSGYYFDVVPRSSISKLPLEMANSIGIIDESYRGEILVPIRVTHPLMGQDETRNSFPQGIVRIFGARPSSMDAVSKQILMNQPKLCQMILRKREDVDFQVVQDLDQTLREDGGFGSTNVQVKTATESPADTSTESKTSKMKHFKRIVKQSDHEEVLDSENERPESELY